MLYTTTPKVSEPHDYILVWQSQGLDPAQQINIWRPIADPEQSDEWKAMGLIVNVSGDDEDTQKAALKADPPCFLVASTQLAETNLLGASIWSNHDATNAIPIGPSQIDLFPISGTGFFEASLVTSPPTGPFPIVDPSILESDQSQIAIFINGEKDHPANRPLQQSLDLASSRQVLELDGIEQYLALPPIENIDFSDGFTVELWAYFRRPAGSLAEKDGQTDIQNNDLYPILDCSQDADNPDNRVQLWYDRSNNTLRFKVEQGGNAKELAVVDFLKIDIPVIETINDDGTTTRTTQPPIEMEMDSWIHIALTIQSDGTYQFFKNGHPLVDETGAILKGTGALLPTNALRKKNFLGKNREGDHFNGFLTELRLWNRSQHDEIDGYFNREIGFLPGLIGYWPLNDGPQSDQILDFTDHPFDIDQLEPVAAYPAGGNKGYLVANGNRKLNLVKNDIAGLTGNLTIETWFRINGAITQHLVLIRNVNRWSLELVKDGPDIRVAFFFKVPTTPTIQVALSDQDSNLIQNGWTHLAVVFKGIHIDHDPSLPVEVSELISGFFIDGRFVHLKSNTSGVSTPNHFTETTNTAFNDKIFIGHYTNLSAPVDLYLAEIRLWNALVPPVTLAENRFYQLTAKDQLDPQLIGYWPLNEELNDFGPLILPTTYYEGTDLSTPSYTSVSAFAHEGPSGLRFTNQFGEVKSRRKQSFIGGGQKWFIKGKASSRLSLEKDPTEGLTGKLTIETWFLVEKAFVHQLVLLRNEGLWSLELVQAGQQIQLAFFYKANGAITNNWSVALSNPFVASQINAWQQVAITYDGGQAGQKITRLLIDGADQLSTASSTLQPYTATDPNLANQLIIGHPDQREIKLLLAEVRLWDADISTADLASRRSVQLSATDRKLDALVAYWPLEENIADRVYRHHIQNTIVSDAPPLDLLFIDSGLTLHQYPTETTKTIQSFKAGGFHGHLVYQSGSARLNLQPLTTPEVIAGDLSISCWLKALDDLSGTEQFILVRNKGLWSLEWVKVSGNWQLVFFYKAKGDLTAAWSVATIPMTTTPQWHHIVVNYNAGTGAVTNIYLDDTLQTIGTTISTLAPRTITAAIHSNGQIVIGDPDLEHQRVAIAELQLWDVEQEAFNISRYQDFVLTTNELADPHLVAYWPLDNTDEERGSLSLVRLPPPPPPAPSSTSEADDSPNDADETDTPTPTDAEGVVTPPPVPIPVFQDDGLQLFHYDSLAKQVAVGAYEAAGLHWHLQSEDITGVNQSDEFTINFSCKAGTSLDTPVVLFYKDSEWSFEIQHQSGNGSFVFFDLTSNALVSAWPMNISAGEWMHVSLIWNGGSNQAQLWLNGTMIPATKPTGIAPQSLSDFVAVNGTMIIGHPSESIDFVYLAEISLWSTSLSGRMIKQQQGAQLLSRDQAHSHLIGYLPLHGNQDPVHGVVLPWQSRVVLRRPQKAFLSVMI